jgi:hypothetical protein
VPWSPTAWARAKAMRGVLMVTATLLPGADRFAQGQPIAAISNTVLGFSFEATREIGEPVHRSLATSNSVWYVWKAPLSGVVTFNTRGSTFDTVLAVYTGPDLKTLTELVSDDDGGEFHTSQVSWNAQAGTEYRIVIDGVTGETGMYVCQWNLEITLDRIPVFVQSPRSQTNSIAGRNRDFRRGDRSGGALSAIPMAASGGSRPGRHFLSSHDSERSGCSLGPVCAGGD